ncbi:hypothetical protein HNY73_019099 [Argiope bruennichi]|uniref:DUF7041 domain-containing protein n=1 Tax=Argiope bruennichi TaxID=94029 RepID=A0A8T0EFS4_ARGBR|nr:hypothetical protein HNY73_019099 [Argiope bruennichi]
MPDDNQDSASNDVTISRVGIKLPPFWKANPALWFVQLEAQFAEGTADDTKFNYIIYAVDSDILNSSDEEFLTHIFWGISYFLVPDSIEICCILKLELSALIGWCILVPYFMSFDSSALNQSGAYGYITEKIALKSFM